MSLKLFYLVGLAVSYFLLHLRTYDTKRVIFGPYQTVYYWAAYGIFMIFTYIIISSGEIWIRAKRGEKSTLHNCICIQFPFSKETFTVFDNAIIRLGYSQSFVLWGKSIYQALSFPFLPIIFSFLIFFLYITTMTICYEWSDIGMFADDRFIIKDNNISGM